MIRLTERARDGGGAVIKLEEFRTSTDYESSGVYLEKGGEVKQAGLDVKYVPSRCAYVYGCVCPTRAESAGSAR